MGCKNHPQMVTVLLDLPSDLPYWDNFLRHAGPNTFSGKNRYKKGPAIVLCQNLQYIFASITKNMCIDIDYVWYMCDDVQYIVPSGNLK